MNPERENALHLAGALDLLRPHTSEELLDILGRHAMRHVEGGQPYDADSMDDDLCDLLDQTWKITWLDGEHHWTAHNTATGSVITYCEGDVYARDDTTPPPTAA